MERGGKRQCKGEKDSDKVVKSNNSERNRTVRERERGFLS